MRMNLKNLLWLFAAAICFASCSKEDIIEKVAEIPEGKILVGTEIVIDGVDQSDTRAVSEAGYTTGDGLYDKKDKVTVAAFANEGYELVTFYDKKDPNINLGASYTLTVQEPRTFKAEFARKYTITVSANPTAGGTVAGGGTYRGGKTCTLTATANAGYVFDGWYEGSTKVSSDTNYSFIVSSNRTITGKFKIEGFIIVGDYGYIISPFGTLQIGNDNWSLIAHGNGRYVVIGTNYGMATTSTNGAAWSEPQQVVGRDYNWYAIAYGNNKFVVVGYDGYSSTSTDGVNWTTPKKIGTTSDNWHAVTYANGKFVALRAATPGSYGGAGYISTSTDGINWTTPKSVGTVEWYGICYGNGKYVAVGGKSSMVSSTDGINWYRPFQIGDGTFSWSDITYGNGIFVAMGRGGYIATSSDGVNWTTPKEHEIKYLSAISYANGEFVVIGSKNNNMNYISTSVNGVTWSIPKQVKDENGQPLINIQLNGICAMP